MKHAFADGLLLAGTGNSDIADAAKELVAVLPEFAPFVLILLFLAVPIRYLQYRSASSDPPSPRLLRFTDCALLATWAVGIGFLLVWVARWMWSQ